MANEYPSAKKEPPWLSILPPVPRISVSTNSRARLSHRCPILLSSPTPLPLPLPLPLPKAVVPSTPSALSSKSLKNSEETSSRETPRPMPSAASSSPVAVADVSWPGSSSPGLDRFDSTAPAAALNPDAVCKPVNSCSLGNNNYSGNSSSLWTDSDFVRPNPEECIPAYGSNSAISCPIFQTLSAPALQQQCSCEDDQKDAKEGAEGFTVLSVGGVNGGKEPDSGKSNENGCTSNDMEFTTAGTTSSATGLNSLEEVDESRRADIRVKQENCSGAARETEISYLGKDEKLVVDDAEVEEGQLLGNGVNEATDRDFGEPGEAGCTSSDMEFAVAWTTLSARCLDTLEEVDEGNGADVRVKQESCEISYLVEDENLAIDGVEVEEGQLRGDGVNAAKDPDWGKPGENDCTTSDMEFTVVETTSSTRCLNLSEEAEEVRGACSSENLENCPDNGREAELPDSVKNEEFILDEGELEEGQLPGEWSGGEELQEVSEFDQTLEESATVSLVVKGVSISPEAANVADHMYYPFQVEEIPSEKRIRGNSEANKGKKKKKHKKGEGSKKRSREKSKEKYNEVLKKRRVEGKWVDGASNPSGLRNSKDCSNGTGKLKKVPEISPQTIPKKPAVDEGPEDGEILFESTKTNNGILSSLVEDEVGLWTTDNVDDQFVTEMEQDGTVKKKRGPETAERKLKRKIAKRKKRAQKERELGIRRPPRTTQSRPVKVLCTHYMKGRCAKGDQCTYSHDAVPLTKLEPCKFLMSHTCLKGDDCPYSHDLRAFPCKFFHTRGLCYDGANCKFSHGAISEEALEKLKQRVEKEKKERTNSISAFDVPTPSFSTPLPPELDPDPLGWGTSTTYSNHEEPIQHTNPTILDHSCGDFNPENQAGTSPALDIMSGQSIHVSHQSIDTNDTKFDAVSRPQQIVEKTKEWKYMQTSNTEAMESGKSMHLRGSKRDAESPGPMGLQSSGAPYNLTMPRTLKTPVCSSPSNGRINAREVLEVSRMDDAQQNLLEEPSTNSNESCTQGVLSVVHSSMVSPLAGKLGVALLRGRQLGSLVVEKNGKSPLPAESKRQHTVESLLGEALRQ